MKQRLIKKIGYFNIYEVTQGKKITYIADSGKTILLKRINKRIPNKYRVIKEFRNIADAEKYIQNKLNENKEIVKKSLSKVPKSLYLVLIKEEKSGLLFVKVGITAKKFIMRRFSKAYGYDGYKIDTILRRVDNIDAEKIEETIKKELDKNKMVSKYRPLLESFSGYSECYNYRCLDTILNIFDKNVLKLT